MKEDKNFDQVYQRISYGEEIELEDILITLWDGKKIITYTFLFFLVASILYSFFSTPLYKSKVTFVVNDSGQSHSSALRGLGGFASMAGFDLASENNDKFFYFEVVKSRVFLSHFIKKNNLLPILYEKKWDKKNKNWMLKEGESPPNLKKGCDKLKSLMQLSENKSSGLISLEIKWIDPYVGALFANNIVSNANKYIKNMKIKEYTTTIEYLKKQIDETSVVNMQKIFYKLIEQQIQKKSLAEVKKDFAFQVLDPAVPADLPFKPRKKVIVLLGSLTGVFIGVFIVFILRFIRESGISFKR